MPKDWRLAHADAALALGDLPGARRILQAHLAEKPDDEDARRALDAVERRLAEPEPPATTRREPPRGMGLLAAGITLLGVYSLVAGGMALLAGHAGGLLVMALGAVEVGIAHGLWRLRRWAWLAGAAILVAGAVGGAVDAWRAPGPGPLASVALHLALLAYFARVRGRFAIGRAPADRPAAGAP